MRENISGAEQAEGVPQAAGMASAKGLGQHTPLLWDTKEVPVSAASQCVIFQKQETIIPLQLEPSTSRHLKPRPLPHPVFIADRPLAAHLHL